MKKHSLNGSVIIVAGAAGAIGAETSRVLASSGSILVLTNRPNPRLGTLLNEIRSLSPGSIAVEGDLSLPDTWNGVVGSAVSTFGRVDALVNCVGTIVPGPIQDLSVLDINEVMGANLLSHVYGVKAAITAMKDRKTGHIVIVGSLGGIVPMPFEALYSSTKFALRGLCLSLNEELRERGVSVSLVEPGPVRGRMLSIEATDDRSTISFVQSPLEPAAVAQAIANVLRSPEKELILPRRVSLLARFVGALPTLFSILFPLLHLTGRRRLRNFRKTLQPQTVPTTE